MYVELANCIFTAHIEYRNISIQKNCQPVQNPLILYYPHAYPPPILSHPMHALPLFYPTPGMHSPCAIPPPVLSHPMHVLPLFYPTHACPPPILSHLMHAVSPYSILAHAHTPPILSQPMHTLPPILS